MKNKQQFLVYLHKYICICLRQAQTSLTYEKKENPIKRKPVKGSINIKVLHSEYAMLSDHLQGVQ